MADLGAWIFSLANNLQHIDTTASGTTLADITWALYEGKCHRCKEIPCVCVRGSYSLELAERGAMGPSHWDERTGLANYKACARYIERATKLHKQKSGLWSLISFDLDDFGKINKEHGHQVGDAVLLEVAERVKRTIGDAGVPFRRGGEEFIVILEQSHTDAQAVAERIRRVFESSPMIIECNGKKLSLSVRASFGVASTNVDGGTPHDLESISDARAREAKQAGKNRVVPALSRDTLDWLDSRRAL